jgi:hypothetical protein
MAGDEDVLKEFKEPPSAGVLVTQYDEDGLWSCDFIETREAGEEEFRCGDPAIVSFAFDNKQTKAHVHIRLCRSQAYTMIVDLAGALAGEPD